MKYFFYEHINKLTQHKISIKKVMTSLGYLNNQSRKRKGEVHEEKSHYGW